jgi:8-oxo-dGTP diphosphatase
MDKARDGLHIRYPQLFAPRTWLWGPLTGEFSLFEEPPEPELVSNVALVPRAGDKFVIVQTERGRWNIPGGTVEPGESWEEALRREVIEEAGAEVLGAAMVGGWSFLVHREWPFRPHIPHPRFYRVVYSGTVRITGQPQPVEGGEVIQDVRCVWLDEAVRLLLESGRPELAELYQLCAEWSRRHR